MICLRYHSRVTPSIIKNIFKRKSATSAPGEDGIMYGVLAKMPSTHYFLATLYNRLDSRVATIEPAVLISSLTVGN